MLGEFHLTNEAAFKLTERLACTLSLVTFLQETGQKCFLHVSETTKTSEVFLVFEK